MLLLCLYLVIYLNWFGHAVRAQFALCASKRMDVVTASKGSSDDDVGKMDMTEVVNLQLR